MKLPSLFHTAFAETASSELAICASSRRPEAGQRAARRREPRRASLLILDHSRCICFVKRGRASCSRAALAAHCAGGTRHRYPRAAAACCSSNLFCACFLRSRALRSVAFCTLYYSWQLPTVSRAAAHARVASLCVAASLSSAHYFSARACSWRISFFAQTPLLSGSPLVRACISRPPTPRVAPFGVPSANARGTRRIAHPVSHWNTNDCSLHLCDGLRKREGRATSRI